MYGGRLGLLIVLGMALAPAGVAWPAAEASPKGPPSESASEPQESERRPLRELLYGATPEERERLAEERKRLSAAAAAFGTDPTAIIGFYQLTYGYGAFTNNLRLDTATAVVQVPLTPNWFVRATLPYVWADSNQPRGSTADGTSDTLVRTAGRLYASRNVALVIGSDASFPTAAKNELGTGKYTLGPGGAVGVASLIATGNPVGLIVGGGAKAYGEYSGSSKIEGRAKATAKEIADKIRPRFEQQGWIK